MNPLRFGIIGVGNMGSHHATTLKSMPDAQLAALCDCDPERIARWREHYRTFTDARDMMESGEIEAVIIATPHYDHPPLARAAFECGLHVLSEKPLAADVAEARQIEALHRSHYSHLKFAIMFQVRTAPVYRKMRQMIADRELGAISRLTWIATDWFRTWSYYASGGWRATWKGEGGGLLLNQCPHNLDLIQWLLGGLMPQRITAVACIGKTHPIEVEDEITAILEYSNGAVAQFIATTGEAPGTNRLEIAGDRGLLICEHGRLQFRRTRGSVKTVREQSPDAFPQVENWDVEVPLPTEPQGTEVILRNLVRAIRSDEPLISPAGDGVRSLEIGNAMAMAGLTRQPVELPLDGRAYRAFLDEMARTYGGRKTIERREVATDVGASFATRPA